MRDLINLMEKLLYKGELNFWGEAVDTEVYENPSRFEIKRLRARRGDLRGLMDFGQLIVWPAEDATHSDMAKAMRVDGADLHILQDWVEVNDYDPDATDEQAAEFAKEIKEHPSIIAIYGPDVKVYIEATDTGKLWEY